MDPVSIQMAESLVAWINLPSRNWGISFRAVFDWDVDKNFGTKGLECLVLPNAIPSRQSITRAEDEVDYTIWVAVEEKYGPEEKIPKAWINQRIALVERLNDQAQNIKLPLSGGATAIVANISVDPLIDYAALKQERLFRAWLEFTVRDPLRRG